MKFYEVLFLFLVQETSTRYFSDTASTMELAPASDTGAEASMTISNRSQLCRETPGATACFSSVTRRQPLLMASRCEVKGNESFIAFVFAFAIAMILSVCCFALLFCSNISYVMFLVYQHLHRCSYPCCMSPPLHRHTESGMQRPVNPDQQLCFRASKRLRKAKHNLSDPTLKFGRKVCQVLS